MEYSNQGLSLYQLNWNERLSVLIGSVVNFGWAGRPLHDLLISSGTDFTWTVLFEGVQIIPDNDEVTELTLDVPWLSWDE